MKARNPSTGNLETVYVKALDSLPVGTIVDYDGQASDIPTGWETYGTNQIKKTSETRPLTGHVVNTYSESEGNAYSCDYSNKAFGGTILWTNDSPTSSFASQTISIDLSDYNTVDIYAVRFNTTGGRQLLHYKILIDVPNKNTQMFYCDYENGVRTWNRNVDWTTSSITFGNATINGSSSNGALIPYKIVGYK